MPLNRERMTTQIGDGLLREIGVKAGAKLYAGGLAVLDNGLVAPGRVATGLVAIGRVEVTADNTTGANGAISAKVRRGVYGFANSATDPVLAADVGKDCFVVDDETVARTSAANTRSVAGKVFQIDGNTVFVEFF